jgi:hypothetical protein
MNDAQIASAYNANNAGQIGAGDVANFGAQQGYGQTYNQQQLNDMYKGARDSGWNDDRILDWSYARGLTPDQIASARNAYGGDQITADQVAQYAAGQYTPKSNQVQGQFFDSNAMAGQGTQGPTSSPGSTPTMGAPSNPFLGGMADAIGQQLQQNYDRRVAPSLRGNAIAAGGYGGSRQGIAEGIALGDMQQGLANSLANLYGQSYESEQGRNLQREMQGNQLAAQRDMFGQNLGWQKQQFGSQLGEQQRQFNAGQGNWQQQFGEGQRQFDTNRWMQQQQFDMNALLQGTNLANQASMLPYQQLAMLGGIGGQMQGLSQAQIDAVNNNFLRYAGVLQPGAQLGQSQVSQGPGGSAAAGILGGGMAGYQMGGPWGALAGGILGGIG